MKSLTDVTNPTGCVPRAIRKFVSIRFRRNVFLDSTNSCRQSVAARCDDERWLTPSRTGLDGELADSCKSPCLCPVQLAPVSLSGIISLLDTKPNSNQCQKGYLPCQQLSKNVNVINERHPLCNFPKILKMV